MKFPTAGNGAETSEWIAIWKRVLWIGNVCGWWEAHVAVYLQHVVPPLEGFLQLALSQQIIEYRLKRAKARLNTLFHAVFDEF
jgi:hypothetical protein